MKRTWSPAIAIGAMVLAFVWSAALGLPQLRETASPLPAVLSFQTSSVQK